MPPTVISRAKANAGRGAPVESSSAAAILEKVRQQARRLVEQELQLQCALAYGKLCERRILELQPGQALPLTAEHIKQQQDEPRPRPGLPLKPQPSGGGGETVPNSELDTMRERAELAEAALARVRGRLPARLPTLAAAAGEPSTSGADGSSGSSAAAEDQLQIASVEALRAARKETERQRKVAATAARESMKALEEAAGMPNGSAQVLRAHAASERTINELRAAVESADATIREQLTAGALKSRAPRARGDAGEAGGRRGGRTRGYEANGRRGQRTHAARSGARCAARSVQGRRGHDPQGCEQS